MSADAYGYYRGKSDRYIAHDSGATFVDSFAYGVTNEEHAIRLTALANDLLALRRSSLWHRLRWALRPSLSCERRPPATAPLGPESDTPT